MIKLRYLLALALVLWCGTSDAQQQHGFAPCSANSIAVSNVSANVLLSKCGPSVMLMNITSQEAFYNLGTASSTAATTSNYSIPGGAYVLLQVPNLSTTYYIAAITSTSTTTLRVVQGSAQ